MKAASDKRKSYFRHTRHQIQELESFFKRCPHPDAKQREELGLRLSLKPARVKFWFQNKRTQMKTQHEHNEITQLRNENETLLAENIQYKETLSRVTCPNCSEPAATDEMSFNVQQLRSENAGLRAEINRISVIAAQDVGEPTHPSHDQQSGPEAVGEMDGPADKHVIIELAVAAVEELMSIARAGQPLWVPGNESSTETLNEEEYARAFPGGIGLKPMGFKSETSRESGVVILNQNTLVEILMDVNQWSAAFSSIVARALTLEVLSTGAAGNQDGALQVIRAEFQVPTPFVPTREYYFARYCKQLSNGMWAVVDVSLDSIRPPPVAPCRRRPSGCLIQELPDGYSKVTWVEHAEIDDTAVPSIYRAFLNSGLGFGAKRWLSTLDRHCERFAYTMIANIPGGENGVICTPEGRMSMLKLSERLVTRFHAAIGASTANTWADSGAADVMAMISKSVGPGRPTATILGFATSFWLPLPPKRVFDFLRDETSRAEWDLYLEGGRIEQMAHIATGLDHGNGVSLMHINNAKTLIKDVLMVQDTSTDATGSYVIYATVNTDVRDVLISGEDPDHVSLLPSGFVILPDGSDNHHGSGGGADLGGNGGSLLTISFQIRHNMDSTPRMCPEFLGHFNALIKAFAKRVKAAMLRDNV